jgi:hypothetical protein
MIIFLVLLFAAHSIHLTYVKVIILIVFILYSFEKLRKSVFAWGYTLFSPLFTHGSDSIRAKLFKTLPTLEKNDNFSQLVVILFY